MFMFLGSILFGLIFVFIAPVTRNFLLASLAGAGGFLSSWAPLSYIVVGILLASPLVMVYVIKTWPVHVVPENPMAKYRRDPLDDED